MRLNLLLIVAILGAAAASAETIRLPVVQDNSIALLDTEWNENAGEQGRIRIKGNQHIVAMAFDMRAVEGKHVDQATLVCVQGDKEISGVTISTIAAPWDENRSTAVTASMSGLVGWGYAGAKFPAVIGGNSFTLAEHSPSDLRDGVYRWNVPPDAVHAMAIGVAYGLAIHEDEADYGRNPTIFAHEQSSQKPYLEVQCHDVEQVTLTQPLALHQVSKDSDVLQVVVTAPQDAFAYDVFVGEIPLGRHNIPLAIAGEQQTIVIRDLPEKLLQREHARVDVVARSRTGQSSQAAVLYLSPGRSGAASVVAANPIPASAAAEPPASGISGESSPPQPNVIPATDKYDIDGKPIGELPDDYREHNSIFRNNQIHLSAAAGEVVSFQMLLRGKDSVSVKLDLPSASPRVDWFEAVYVPTAGRLIPDPLVPLEGPIELKPDQDRAIVADVYVPFDAEPGIRRGAVEISDGRRVLIEMEVLPFALPRVASFSCEMNGYGLPETVQQYEALQRIAYDHRVHANILYYSHHTAAPGARKTNLDMRLRSGRRMDNRRYDDIPPGAKTAYWDDFVDAFGSYLDGSLFKDGHRGPIAAPGFYLSFHESWPLNCRAFYNGDPDAFEAFDETPEYGETYVNVLKDFVKLAKSKGWNHTGFQVYFNNKGSRDEVTKAPWVLDEPASYWDYRALRYYGELTDRGREAAVVAPSVNIDFRIDISRPEFCRGQLEGRDDLWVVSSSAFKNYRRLVTDRMRRDGLRVWIYGSANDVRESNRDIEAWALDAWSGGASGIVPWQTINKDGTALKRADQLGLFIFAKNEQGQTVINHSMRLQAFRDAEQLIEYLNLLQTRKKWSRAQINAFVRQYVDLDAAVNKTHEADAGTSRYRGVTPSSLEELRLAAAKLLVN